MSYLLDTDVVIDRLNEDPATIQLLATLASAGLAISIVTSMEVLTGVLLAPDPNASRAKANILFQALPIHPFTPAVAERTAAIKAELIRRNRPARRRALDLIIAATAIEHGLTLVTRNTSDYQQIPGLNLYSAEATQR